MKRRSFFGLATLGGALLSGGVFAATRGSGANPYYTGPVSAHFDGRNFFNPGGVPPGSFGDLLRWQLGGGRTAWPDKYPSPFPPAIPSRRVVGDELRVTMVGHATMLVQTAGLNILTDPVWSDRVSPVSFAGPRRYNEPGIVFEELPPIDVVLISHNHYDHLDISTIRRLVVEHDPLIIAPLGNDTIIQEDVGTARVSVGDWGDATRINEAVRVHIEPCHHWSARGSADRRMALWAAFVIETPAGKIYHIGDTGYHDGINYRDAAEKFGAFRLAILPIGAYEPRWFMKGQHQNPDEAVRGFLACNAKYFVGHHWGTFRLTNEGVEAPIQALGAALTERDVAAADFRAMRPGEVWEVPE